MMFRTATCVSLIGTLAICHDARAQQNTARAGDDLPGLWGAEAQLGPQVRGPLLVARQGSQWSVRVSGFEARAEQHGDSVTIALPGGQGKLKVWMRARAAAVQMPEAYWVQPAGMNTPYATPVLLRRVRINQWSGEVVPVPEQFSLYLMITRDNDSALRGTFRNPDMNWSGRTPYYSITRIGDNIVFTNPRTGKAQYTQAYDSARRTIAFDFGAPVILAPRTRERAIGFVTRSPSLPPYMYRAPPDVRDGWVTTTAARTQMDTAALQSIVRSLIDVDPLSETEPRVHSVVIARNGQLVLDEYFRGYDANMVHDLRSASKTMTSIMAGAAMQRRASIDGTPLSSRTAVGTSGMNLGHLLSHSTGLACNDDDSASPGNEDTMQSQQVQNDWYAYFMALPRLTSPGTVYSYCSAGINMAGGVIGRAAGLWLPRLFETALARPMSFGAYGINLMPTGDAYSGGGMRIRPRDLLKFGQLYLDGGVWNGNRLVPEAWVRTSTAHVMGRADGSDDGFGWHRNVLDARGRRYQTYSAGGNGGQFLVVVPELRLVVVVTAGNYGQYDVWQKIRERLIPSIMEAAR